MTPMTAVDWLPVLVLGAVLGATGQILRTIPGLKKLSDAPGETFDPMQLMVSMVIGAAAGVIGAVTLQFTSEKPLSTQDVFMLIAIGYTGADFIEAFINKSQVFAGSLAKLGPATPQTPPESNPNIPTPASLGAMLKGPEQPLG